MRLAPWAAAAFAAAALAQSPPPPPPVALVESAPVETSLDHPDIPDAKDVWPELLASAKKSLDVAEFYVVDEPGKPLHPVLQAVETAAARGVQVRLLADAGFARTYPESLDRLARVPGITVRRYDVKSLMGGILHAKYFVVDRERAYLGSQNFDWRSLEHIQELGVEVSQGQVAGALEDVFETDWALAGGGDRAARVRTVPGSAFPVQAGGAKLTLVADPKGWLPDESLWSLPRLVALVDSARRDVRVQVLTYRARGKVAPFPELEEALRRAAARGVKVELLVSNWSQRPATLDGLKALHAPPGLTVKLVTIPQWSGGFIPYARVVHAKYLVVDGRAAWVGTSNWERDYFFESRNVG
ncbi:MAG TPA: phospholipase D-like domain-containing protein, partial [Myxococcales bacterium]|nr:phospholipase D-like domain-containing protein [Myxococcales bacterium]